MTLIQDTDALLKRCVESGDAVNRMFNAFTLMRLRELATGEKSRAKNRAMRRRLTKRAVALLGREPATILAAIASDRVKEVLVSNPARRVHVA